MKEDIQTLLAIIDEVTIALGEILLSHRQLTEDFLERHGIEQAQDRIEQRRAEIRKERERIAQMRDALRHRREVEQIRKHHEKESEENSAKETQTEQKNGDDPFFSQMTKRLNDAKKQRTRSYG